MICCFALHDAPAWCVTSISDRADLAQPLRGYPAAWAGAEAEVANARCPSRPVQRIQILGGAVGDFFDTQIGASQRGRTDDTLGVGMSAT